MYTRFVWDPELGAFSAPSIPGSHCLFQTSLLLFNEDLYIDRFGTNGTDIASCGLVVVRLANLLTVWTSNNKRSFFFGFWHGVAVNRIMGSGTISRNQITSGHLAFAPGWLQTSWCIRDPPFGSPGRIQALFLPSVVPLWISDYPCITILPSRHRGIHLQYIVGIGRVKILRMLGSNGERQTGRPDEE